MPIFTREMGRIGGPHYWETRYIPNLSMPGTAELFDHIPEQGPWKLPKPYNYWDKTLPESYREKWDGLLTEWIQYLDRATKGFQIGHMAATEHIVSGESLEAAIYFKHGRLETANYEEDIAKIASARRAFSALLSTDAREKLKLKPGDARASDEDIQNARRLVSNFNRTS